MLAPLSREIAAVLDSPSAVVRPDGEFSEFCTLLVSGVFQNLPVLG